ncbi:hypothetical protein MHY87_08600 [Microvirga sp. ACRRW]|uniref:hypothetical protein n=1 Tax=Microvirga sp. ACRRW TaxID=2918205 RepID=UPI001EF520FB|nr:hypothetical protein [Microvirga sp. ACRRW]MCG7392961.1 hypothetical protein [Microvirga sp. ACRRW]
MNQNVVSLNERTQVPVEMAEGIDSKTGLPTLRVFFPRVKKDDSVDLSFLFALPNLKAPLAEGFREWGRNAAPTSRHQLAGELRRGLVSYLIETGRQDARLEDFDSTLLNGFVNWLNQVDPETGSALWERHTRAGRYYSLIPILKGLSSKDRWRAVAEAVFDNMPKKVWKNLENKKKPTERLTMEELDALLAAISKEIIATSTLLAEGQELLERGRSAIPPVPALASAYREKAVCLATLAALPLMPSRETLKDLGLSTLYNACRPHGGLLDLIRYLCPTSRTLVPFVLNLAIATAYNPGTLFGLKLSDIQRDSRLGEEIIRLPGSKKRAAEDPIVTIGAGSARPSSTISTGPDLMKEVEDDSIVLSAASVDGIGIGLTIDLITQWTALFRNDLEGEDRDRLFLHRSATRRIRLAPLNNGAGWQDALAKFCKDHNLRPFNLKQIRATILDEIQYRTGDIRVAKALGRHRKIATTWSHYTSDGTKQRQRERLGLTFVQRERWFLSDGTIDPRRRTHGMDQAAATPGFLCLDPYDGVIPGQRRGYPCLAYGKCVDCPMAAARPNDPVSVAHYIALERAILQAREVMDPKTWMMQWGARLLAVQELNALAPDKIRRQAAAYPVTLPTVG